MDDILSLSDLPRALRDHGVDVDYHTCWRHCTNGTIPAGKLGKRWFIKRDHLPQIAAALSPAPAEQ